MIEIHPERIPLSVRGRQVLFLCVLATSLLLVFACVDLSPTVDSNFFFASDDPQLQANLRIRELFPERPQVIVSAAGDISSPGYHRRVANLSRDLMRIDGVLNVRDIHHGPEELEDAFENDLWRRLLISEDGDATNLIVTLETEDFRRVIPPIEDVLARHETNGFALAISGVPYVVEQIRIHVVRDLKVFGLAVVAVFGLLIAILFRSGWILVGTLVAAGTAASLTLLVRTLLGLEADVLTPNISTIIFVITLSHVFYITANWKNAAREGVRDPVSRAIEWTGPGSGWGMVTALLGFLSLLLTSAEPVRNFGLSCSVGTVLALLGAYVIYPAYLASADPKKEVRPGLDRAVGAFFGRRHNVIFAALLALVALAVPGLLKLNADPSLFDYFAEGTELRQGLERIDRTGGSSPLELVIRDAGGEELSDDDVFERMWRLQLALERDPAVGSVISLPVLMAEAEDEAPFPFNFLLDWDDLLDELEKPKYDRVARGFVTEGRNHGRFLLRMKETGREQRREEIVGRLEGIVRRHGFVPVLTGGLYPLQGRLSSLLGSSLVTGLLGLMALFAVIAFVVSRSLGTATAMIASFAMVPILPLGIFGYLGVPLDVISMPAGDVALGMAMDDMIHMAYHVRRKGASRGWEAWVEARRDLWRAHIGSAVVVSIGFSLLLLSAFPPTRRLGLSVVLGTITALALVLFVFPRLAAAFEKKRAR